MTLTTLPLRSVVLMVMIPCLPGSGPGTRQVGALAVAVFTDREDVEPTAVLSTISMPIT